MTAAYLLIFTPILLFVIGFLIETYLSIARLKKGNTSNHGYVDATWEVTNTLLVFGVVMLLMLFTKSIDVISSAIFLPTMLAGAALLLRAICYLYIFYVQRHPKITVVDYLFAISHVCAAGLLVITVVKATIVLITEQPEANLQFLPYFWPGLIFVLAICGIPALRLYRTR